MTAPLARDQFGNPVPLPPEAKYFLVRRHTGGRPANITGPDGQPLQISITEDQPDLRARGCSGSIRLDALDAERRQLPVPAIYVELGSSDEPPRASSGEGDKELVRVCFDSMTRTMEGMQRAQVERERTLAQKEQSLTESQIASQKMIVELMLAVLDRVGGAKPQDALSLLKQQFEFQRTLERQAARNAPAADPVSFAPPLPEKKEAGLPPWLMTILPGAGEVIATVVGGEDEAKRQAVRSMYGVFVNGVLGGGAALGATPSAPPAPAAAPPPTQQIFVERRVAPKAMREVLGILNDDEAVAFEQILVSLDNDAYGAICDEVEQIHELDGRVLWARRAIELKAGNEQAKGAQVSSPETTAPRDLPSAPPELMAVLSQLSPDEQMIAFQLVSWLDRATTEKLIARLAAMPPQVALTTVRGMLDEARRRGPSVAQRAVAAALNGGDGPGPNGSGSRRNGAPSTGEAS